MRESYRSKSVIAKNGNPILREGVGGGDAGMQFNNKMHKSLPPK